MLRKRRSTGRVPGSTKRRYRKVYSTASEATLAKIFTNIDVGIAYLDHRFSYLQVNAAYAKAVRSDPDTLIGKRIFENGDNPEIQAIFQSVLERGEAYHAYASQIPFLTKSNSRSTFWDWSVLPISGSKQPGSFVIVLKDVTAREKAQRALQQTQVMFEHLFESAPDANILVDQNGVIVSANQQAEGLFDYSRTEMIGQAVEKLVPEALREIHIKHRTAYALNPHTGAHGGDEAMRALLRLELLARRKDGSLFPAEITLNPIQMEQGLMVLSVIRDISQRRAHEQAMDEQSRLVRLLQDVAIAANEATSVTTAFQFTLDRLCQHLGWSLGHALLSGSDQSMVPTGIWCNEVPEQFSVFCDSSESLRFKSGFGLPGMVMSSGQPVWLTRLPDNPLFERKKEARQSGLETGLAIPVLAGKAVVGVLEFFNKELVPPDPNLLAVLPHIGVQLGRVVERERAQDALRKSAAQLRMVITNLPVILWVVNQQGHLILLEGKGVAASGIDKEQVMEQSIFERLSQRPDLLGTLRRALSGEEIHTEVKSTNGNIFETFFTPYFNSEGSVDGVIGLSIDITERKMMETELEEMRRKLMESVDVERGRLAQQLHDGPLQDLYGAFYQIQEIRSNLDESGQAVAGRALQTIQKVNATLRIICGELRPTTLVHLGLQKAIRSHAELLEDHLNGLTVHLDLAEDVEDGAQSLPHNIRLGLFRIYQQLIDNVIRHSGARHAWVRLRLLPNQVILEVQDSGKGFSVPENWVDMVRNGQFGLATVQERVHGLSGSISINSGKDQGTLVRVMLPRTGDSR